MSDRIVWSSRMTQDYAKGLSDEEKRNFLIDRGYDAEMLDGADLDEIIEQDDYMWQDDAEDFDRTVVPMINRQTYNGIVLAIDKDKDRVIALPAEDLIAGDIASDANGMQLVDEGGLVAKYYFNDIPSDTLELYAIPEGETEQQDFVQDVMQGYADSLRSDSDEEVMPVDIAGALSDPDVLENWVDKDALRKVGMRIQADLSESLDECGDLQFPKEELEEEVTSGIGFENAKRFAEYLNDNEGRNGYFGDEEIVSKGDSVHLYSDVSDMTFTFTDDEGVVVEGQDEEEGTYEEYFDTVDDFVKWYQSMAFTFSSDLGAELGKYLAGGEVDESCEEVKENCDESCEKVEEGCDKELDEAKGKGQRIMADNPEALAEELEEIEMDLEDFGPEGFYNVPYESFKKEFPEFTKDVIETFLIKFVELKPEELNDPEVIEAWKSGDLITEQDWSTLLEGARDLAAGKPTW